MKMIRIRFVVDTQNMLTHNTLRMAGSAMDIREDYGSNLVGKGYAVRTDLPEEELQIESVSSDLPDWDELHTNTIRAQAKDAGLWDKGMGRDEMIEILEDYHAGNQ